MQDQKLLTLCWHSFLGGSCNIVTTIFAHKGSQYYNYGLMSLHSQVIIQDARHTIVDPPLRLISRMGQRVCHFPFYLQTWRIHPHWKKVTMEPFDSGMGMTKNCWRSVDTHLHDILTVIGCSTIARKMHIVSIDGQYRGSVHNHLNSNPLRPLLFCVTTTDDIRWMNNIGPSRYSAFG